MKTTLIATAAALLLAVSCSPDDKSHMSTTGNNVEPNYSGTHYNGAVNSTGSGIGRDDPAVRSSANDATGQVNGSGGGPMMNGSNHSGTPVGGGSSSDNSGSGTTSGGTGNTSMGR